MPILLSILLLVSSIHPAAAPAADPRSSASIYVMRHLPPGEGPDPALGPVGLQQAEALAKLLGTRPIKAIFVTDTRRSRGTAAPLAGRLRILPSVYDPFRPQRLQEAVQAVRGDVLIVGHSNTVADLVGRLGGKAPKPLGHGDFGTIWKITKGRTSTMTLAGKLKK